jgi:ABC-type sugar transport system permease subunit
VPLNIGLSLSVALLINKLPKERRELCSLFFLIPLVIPSGSLVIFWKTFFAYDGALNGILHALGVSKVNWLDSNRALFVMTLDGITSKFMRLTLIPRLMALRFGNASARKRCLWSTLW